MGRTLIILGLILVAIGILMTLGDRLPIKLGRLPGDIVVRGKNGAFYFPIVTCLVVSVALSLAMWPQLRLSFEELRWSPRTK